MFIIKRKISIADTFLLNMMLLTILSTAAVAYFWGMSESGRIRKEVERVRQEYVTSQKLMIRNQVENAIRYINNYRGMTDDRIRNRLKKRTDDALEIIEYIYEKYHTKESPQEIRERIRTILYPEGGWQGAGYIWIVDHGGRFVLNPQDTGMEGRLLPRLLDIKGNDVPDDQISFARNQGKGFVEHELIIPNISSGSVVHRIAYVQDFGHFQWIIGSDEIADESVSDVQDAVLEWLVNFRFGENGYFFGSTYDGKPLFSNGKITREGPDVWNLTDPDGIKIIQEQCRAARSPAGDYVQYSWRKLNDPVPTPKISFVHGIPEWKWMIGAGVYLDEMENIMARRQTELMAELRERIIRLVLLVTVQFLFIILIVRYISYKARTSFDIFSSFFLDASRENTRIDREALHFKEFSALADAANQMIEARNQARQALQKSESLLKMTIEAVNDGIWDWNLLTNCTYFSPRYYTMSGYEPSDFPPTFEEWAKRVHPDDLTGALEEVQRHMVGETEYYETEFRFRKKDGTWMWILGRGQIVERNETGRPCRMIGTHSDITRRREMESVLRDSEETYRNLFRNAQVGLFRSKPDSGRFLECNDALAHMLGYKTREECIRDYYLPDGYIDKGAREKMIALARKNGHFRNYEARFRRKDGGELWMRYSAYYYPEQDWLEGVTEDITGWKKMQAEKDILEEKLHRSRKMEALGLLAGGVAHDLNNILTGVVSYPDFLLSDLPENSPLRPPLEIIRKSGERAAAVVADLLTVARGIASPRETLNLNTLVGEYLGSPEYISLKNSYPFVSVTSCPSANLLNMRCSPVHIRKALMNLMTNACEAVENSGVITVSTRNRYVDKPVTGPPDIRIGEYVVLTVSDNGPGISSEDMERIFEPFYTRKVMGRSGTGLGLAVVWNTVQDHEGYIQVSSSPEGTTFDLYFPADREGPEIADSGYSRPDYSGNGERILVVDDEPGQRDIASRMLTRLGYTVTTASGGAEAVEYMRTGTADLVLLDMIMDPGLNGRETYEAIIRLHPGQKAVIASGFAETVEVQQTQRLGAGSYIKKPYTMEKIGMAVRAELDRK